MGLSAANVVQAKTGPVTTGADAEVFLDNPTQEGSTVIVEVGANGIALMDSGMDTHIPAGFAYDGCSALVANTRHQQVFSKAGVAAGEGVSGSTGWTFSVDPLSTAWHWRATEWDTTLDLVSPLETTSFGTATGTGPTSLSTGTTTSTGRADLVCLAWHLWNRAGNTAQAMTWTGHTNGFAVRDDLRWTAGVYEGGDCWSWLFDPGPAAYETTATINLTTRSASDTYMALLVVYAAAQPEVVAGPTMMAG